MENVQRFDFHNNGTSCFDYDGIMDGWKPIVAYNYQLRDSHATYSDKDAAYNMIT